MQGNYLLEIPQLLFILATGSAFLLMVKMLTSFVFEKNRLAHTTPPAFPVIIAGIFAAAVVLRIILAMSWPGLPNDYACFTSWSETAWNQGLTGVYHNSSFLDYPPLYLYVLWLIGGLRSLFAIPLGSPAYLLLLKLPAIAADLGMAFVIYHWGKKRTSHGWAMLLGLLYFLNPAVITNSAVWCQIDSILTLLVVISVLCANRKQLVISGVVFACAVAVKTSALLIAPVILFAFIQSGSWKKTAVSILASIGVFFAIILPFAISQPVTWIFDLYINGLTQYPFASLNAANLWSALGQNFAYDTTTLLLPIKYWGWIVIGATFIASIFLYFRSTHGCRAILSALFIIASVCIFGAHIHERYLYPVIAFCIFAFIQSKDRRFIFVMAGFTFSLFVNQAAILAIATRTADYNIPADDLVLRLISLWNIGLFAYVVKIIMDILFKKRILTFEEEVLPALFHFEWPAFRKIRHPRAFLKYHRAIIAGTIIYAVVAFSNAGSAEVPQSFWQPAGAGEYGTADLGRASNISSFRIYTGYGKGSYKIETSDDYISWNQAAQVIQVSEFDMMEWRSAPAAAGTSGRYIRVTAQKPGLRLFEMAVLDDRGNPLEMENTSSGQTGKRNNFANLFDEASFALLPASYMNGMYFDETYFARSAYEYTQGDPISENTHPPLGKLIISAGIFIFGNNTFGWRVMGIIAGILLLPLMYSFGIALFRRKSPALAAAFMTCVSFMTFVQSRMATADIFLVVFMTAAAYFMFRFSKKLFQTLSGPVTATPLLGAGIFTGLAVSIKWSAAPLFVGFFVLAAFTVVRSIRHHLRQKALSMAPQGNDRPGEIPVTGIIKKTTGLFLVAGLCIPLAIYTLCFTPFMYRARAGNPLSALVHEQENMYRYHSSIGEDRWYASQWWAWPLDLKPIWLYQGKEGLEPGYISSIVTMGNPLVFWAGTMAIIAAAFFAFTRRERYGIFIVAAFLIVFLPWVIIPRKLTFIYHFLPALPFMILALAYTGAHLVQINGKWKILTASFVIVSAILFAMFYPVLTGMPATIEYVMTWLRWLPSWIFCST